MNTIYKFAFVSIVGLVLVSTNMSAQTVAKDTTLNRQVYLEREYTPTIQDASKVNTVPALHKPQKRQYDIKFEEAIPSISFSSYAVGDTGSGDIQTKINYSKHRGYLTLGAGLYSNVEGALGYRVVDSSRDQLDVFATHTSTNARVKYLDANSSLDKVKAKDMENFVKLRYSHAFDPFTWYLGGSFLNDSYNYYGNPYAVSSSPIFTDENLEKKQSVNIFDVETGVVSKEKEAYEYSGSVRYNRFSLKYGPDWSYDGVAANLIDVNADVLFPIMNNFKVGVKGGIFYQGSGDVKFPINELEDPFHSLTIFKVNPYFNINGDDYKVALGVNFNQALDINDKTVLAPTAKVWWNFQEKSTFYLTIDGGINSNNLVDIYKQNKYVDPSKRVDISKTPYDVEVGIKSGVITGFEFDIFGGYKYTKDEHFYTQKSTTSWANVSDMLYGNLGTGHFGGALKTKLIPYTDLSLKAVGYFYNLKEYTNLSTAPIEKKAWGMPSLTFDFNADFNFIENLVLTAHYSFEGGRKTYINGQSIKMDAVNELNLRANYSLFDWLSIYAKANNILNQKYERYYGYTLQGISILGGVSLKF